MFQKKKNFLNAVKHIGFKILTNKKPIGKGFVKNNHEFFQQEI